MSVVGRLKEELSGVGLRVWTMCLQCSSSTSIRDTYLYSGGGREGGSGPGNCQAMLDGYGGQSAHYHCVM